MTDRPASPQPFVGILGGMGPLAGIDFARKLIEAATELFGAERDQDQVPFVLWSVPQVPDRVGPLLSGEGESPLSAMRVGVDALNGLGVDVIAIACNTAHAWHRDLAATSRAPIPHIAEVTTRAVSVLPGVSKIGLVGTEATLSVGLYQKPLERAGFSCLVPEPDDINNLVKPAIALVKQGRVSAAAEPARKVCERLIARGADAVVLACSELPIALEPLQNALSTVAIDPARIMAHACLAFSASGSRDPER